MLHCSNYVLIFFSVFYTLLISDLLFGIFVVQSDGYGFTLACQRWTQKYWKPINSFGYRDVEHSQWAKNVLFVVGDSFAAGHGVDNIDDRMSEVLERHLGPEWTVATIARPGWDSIAEFNALSHYTKVPNVLIVSYFMNDIERAATAHGLAQAPEQSPPALIDPLIERSFIANWLYWHAAAEWDDKNYFNFLRQAFATPEIFEDHIRDLDKFIQYSKEKGVHLYFVIWPYLSNMRESRQISTEISDNLQRKGVAVIDLNSYFVNRRAEELVVNNFDSHANAKMHAEVANIVFRRLMEDGAPSFAVSRLQPSLVSP